MSWSSPRWAPGCTGSRRVTRWSECMALSFHSRTQFANGAEEVDPHGRFVQPGHRRDVARRVIGVVTQHEDQPLALRQALDGGDELLAPLAGEEFVFGRSFARTR